ncbi:MAG: TatD family hydrolase [Thermodesulfobacteriota bacterium]
MELIDTHSHIDLSPFRADFQEVLEGARQAGVVAQILPGVCRTGWQRILELCAEEKDLYPAIGLHPLYLQNHDTADLELLRSLAHSGTLVAIGEIGLDYFVRDCDRSAQQALFEAQLDIAAQSNLPLLLHVRKGHDQVQAVVRRTGFRTGGIVHAFSGSMQQAEKYLELGFLISICGTITYERATRIRKIGVALPLESLVLETDSPDLPPAARRGQRNMPEYLPEILYSLAQLRPESPEEIAAQTSDNARTLLGL